MATITNKDNLLSVIATEVARSERSENFLIADAQFSAVWVTPEIDRVLGIASGVANRHVAAEALVAHYHTCELLRAFEPVFSDACGGFIEIDNIAVEIRVRKIANSPIAYRVHFTRVNAADLAISIEDRMAAFERRLRAVEAKGQ